MSNKTGHRIIYARRAYAGYSYTRRLYYKVTNKPPDGYHPKEQVMGLELEGKYKAYPFTELSENTQSSFKDEFSGRFLTVHWDESARSAYITDADDEVVVSTIGYWFAWFTFHPQTEVFQVGD